MEWARPDGSSLAEFLTAIFDPPIVVAALLVAVSVPASPWGVLWGIGAAVGAGVVPAIYVLYGVEQHHLRDYTIPARENRPPVLLAATGSAFVTFVLFLVLHAPVDILALLGTLIVGFGAAALVSVFWKVSLHVSALAGAIAILMLTVSPALVMLVPLMVPVAWARLSLRAHTPAQILAGAVLGAAGAALAFTLFRLVLSL